MRAENFSWSDCIHIAVKDATLDLHNAFGFLSFEYNVANRTASLSWRRRSREGVDPDLPRGIRIDFFDVDYLKVEPRDPDVPFSEDDCLDSFGYDSDEGWTDGQFWVDGPAEPAWRWSFVFRSGAEIVIGGARATLTIEANQPSDSARRAGQPRGPGSGHQSSTL